MYTKQSSFQSKTHRHGGKYEITIKNSVNFSPSENVVGLLLYFRNILFNVFCYLFKTNKKKAFWLDLIITSSPCRPSTPRNVPLVTIGV